VGLGVAAHPWFVAHLQALKPHDPALLGVGHNSRLLEPQHDSTQWSFWALKLQPLGRAALI
jgi:hypothetical protein